MTLDLSNLESRPIRGGALEPVVIVGQTRVLLTDTGEQAVATDEINRALVVTDVVHHEVHEGEMFHAENLWASVLNNASANILLVTGAKYPHLAFVVNAGGSCNIYLYEACTTLSDGTALPAYNMQRYSAGISQTGVFHTPTVNALGPALVSRYLPGGTGPTTRVGGGVRIGTEWIVKPSTRYLIRATNVSGSAVSLSIAVEYYEEEAA